MNVLGVGVNAIDIPRAVALIDAALQRECKCYVCVTGVHGIMEAQKDTSLREILNRSFLTTPDGMPTVWVGRLQGYASIRRVFGPELMLAICRMSVSRAYKHFIYGGSAGVATALAEQLRRMYPQIRIVGTYTPPFGELSKREELQIRERFARTRPDITWVGLSTPKQEKFMSEYIHKFETKMMLGVGAAFDIHTGRIKDAPEWVKQTGLQWVHRLIQEPCRLWKRYLFNNPAFVARITLQLLRIRTIPLQTPVL